MTRHEVGWAGLLCGLAVTLFLGRALFTGRVFSPADLLFDSYPWRAQLPPGWAGPGNPLLVDSVLQFEPWLAYSARRLHAGELPLWNPDNLLGAPLVGNMQSALFDPLNWPLLAWPGGALLVLRSWMRLFLAALGMYLLARQVARVRPSAAFIAAITFTFSAYLTVWLLYPLAGTAIWLPWLWWATDRLVKRPSPPAVAALAGIVALALVAGHPETAYHILLATGLFALFAIAQAGGRNPRRLLRALGLWAGAYVLGAVVAAVQLLPFAEYLGQSLALLNRSDPHWPGFWLPASFAWTLVSPDLFGNPAHGNWWAAGITYNYNEVNAYSGVLPLLLAPLALLARAGAQRRLALLLVGIVLLAAGVVYHCPGVYEVITALPFLHTMANHRLLLVVEFALGLLAALGVEAFMARLPRDRRRLAAWLAGTCLVLLLAGVGVPLLWARPLFQVPADSAAVRAVWDAGLIRAVVLLLGSAGLLVAVLGLAVPRPRLARGLLGLLPLLVLADLWQAHQDYNPTIAPDAYFPATPATQFLQSQPGPFRTTGLLSPYANLVYGLPVLTGNDALEPRLYHDLVTAIDPLIPRSSRRHFNAYDMLQSRVWNWLDVGYVLAAPGTDPNYLTDVRQETTGATVGEIVSPNRPGQTFTAGHDNLAGIQVLGATFGGRATGRLIFHLKADPAAAADLATVTLDAAQLPDNAMWSFTFPPVRSAAGRSFYFYLEAPAAVTGRAATVWYSAADPYPGGSRMAGGQPAAGDLAFRTLSLFDPDGPWLVRVLDGGTMGASVFQNRKVFPRAWITHHVEVQPDGAAQVPRLYDPAFSWSETALLAAPLATEQPLPAAPPPAASDAVTITRYAPETVDIATQSAAPGILILADQAFPGWQARVDGQPAAILTADHALRGVYLAAGAHTVRFTYAPGSFQAGAVLTCGGLLALGLLAGWPALAGRRRRGRPA